MRHEFTVRFDREIVDDGEIADKAFPGRPQREQLTAQLCAELDGNPSLVGTYTVASLTIVNEREHFIVNFALDLATTQYDKAVKWFHATLQETYDRHGMAGRFQIL